MSGPWEEKLNHLAKLKGEAASSDHIVYFGHFPSSCVVSDPPLSEVVNGGLVYLSGHLHTLAGKWTAERVYSSYIITLQGWHHNSILSIIPAHLSSSLGTGRRTEGFLHLEYRAIIRCPNSEELLRHSSRRADTILFRSFLFSQQCNA